MATKLQVSIDLAGPPGKFIHRLYGLNPKKRVKKTVYIEKELIEILEKNNPDVKLRYGAMSDMVNLG